MSRLFKSWASVRGVDVHLYVRVWVSVDEFASEIVVQWVIDVDQLTLSCHLVDGIVILSIVLRALVLMGRFIFWI